MGGFNLSQDKFLRDLSTGSTWAAHRDDARTVTVTTTSGRERKTGRDHADKYAASYWIKQEEWKRLKKGMVLLDDTAPWGKPRMHCFVGGAYTGAMAIGVAENGGFFCNRSQDSEEIIHVGTDAVISSGVTLPGGRLVWKMEPAPALGAVLMQVDGGVLRWSPSDGKTQYVQPYRRPPGFLSVTGTHAAWYDGKAAVVQDLASDTELLRFPVQPEMYGGHTPQMEGALSPDGSLLALCARPGVVQLIDVKSGKPRSVLQGDFAMVRHMEFLPDNCRLMILEGYGQWSLWCFDTETGQPDSDWTNPTDLAMASVSVVPSGRRIAVARRDTVTLYEFGVDHPPRHFPLEHIVKRAAIAWISEDALAVRTDYGCASIYSVS